MQGARWTTASVHATQWTAPQHSYEKVVAVLDGSGGSGGIARKQLALEVLSQPGMFRVTTATHTTTRSSTTHFDDLKLSVNSLDVGAQKEKLHLGRRAAMGSRRPPSRNRTPQGRQQNADLLSPSIVKSSSVDIVELDNEEAGNRVSDDSYKISFPDDSDDSFYDSCPEKESVFKDESEHLEEWRRESKIRRSLQFPKRSTYSSSSRLADLPDNWGSVSRIKQELEKCQNHVFLPKADKSDNDNAVDKLNETKGAVDSIFQTDSIDNFTIKPSALKTKSFISVETLNEVRGKLKSLSNGTIATKMAEHINNEEVDDGIEEVSKKLPELEKIDEEVTPTRNVKSYIFGMEAMIKSANDTQTTYPCGSNSLESRVSKLNGVSSKGDEWHARRKSYGFEKVQSSLKSGDSLFNRQKNEIESSTDSGICRSSELVNSLHNSPTSGSVFPKATNGNGKTVVKLGDDAKDESFEDWLSRNRKNIANRSARVGSVFINGTSDNTNNIKPANNDTVVYLNKTNNDNNNKNNFNNTDIVSKRHTIAVDSVKDIKQLYESRFPGDSKINFLSGKHEENNEDMSEKKSKKVEFCKTEVHFAAESGKVNIVETDEKPPPTNNFRRRRRNSGTIVNKDTDKNSLPALHFGDNPNEKENGEAQEEQLKLNYAVITEIKSNKEETSNDHLNGDDSDDQPRGILKNKPIKPIPYHLGEEKEIVPQPDKNLWGVKLRPVQNDTPLWKSSVSLKNMTFDKNNAENGKSISEDKKSVDSKSEEKLIKISENKGYSTKVNFGNGTPIVETSYRQNENSSIQTIKDVLYQSKPTLINSRTALIYKPNNCETKMNNISTKITIDMSPKNNIKDSVLELKSTALVKGSRYEKSNGIANSDRMFIIEKNDKQNIKTAFRSKVNGFQKFNDMNREQSGDSADEEVRSLMSVDREDNLTLNNSCSWSKLRTFRSLQHNSSAIQLHQKLLTNYPNNTATHMLHNRKDIKHEDIKTTVRHSSRDSPPKNIVRHSSRDSPPKNTVRHSSRDSPPKNGLSTSHIKPVNSEKLTGFHNVNTLTKATKEENNLSNDFNNLTKKDPVTSSLNFGDSLNTPRSMLPGRGSARKLKEHELSYFGVKASSNDSDTNKPVTKLTESKKTTEDSKKTIMQQINDEKRRDTRSEPNTKTLPIYENVNIKMNSLKSNKTSSIKTHENKTEHIPTVSMTNGKHPGETIIEELTKAADEILQALNGYTDEESIIINSTDDDDEFRQTRRISKLDTITEGAPHKSSRENKAVQANLIHKSSRSANINKNKVKTSSNSSLESVSKEQQSSLRRRHLKTEEKSQKKKSSSVELIKARRLQRANSRDAFFQNHGSSSEDLANHQPEVVVRKRTVRRSKGDSESKTSSKSSITRPKVVEYNNDVSKASLKSILSVVPEIRHKTAVSTIRNISDRRSHKDKNTERSSSNHQERSRRRERLYESTISSMAKERIKHDRPRSADTSLERESIHSKDNVRAYVPLSKRESRYRDSSNERDRHRKHEDREKKKLVSNLEKQDTHQVYQNVQPISGYSRSSDKLARTVRKITSRTEC